MCDDRAQHQCKIVTTSRGLKFWSCSCGSRGHKQHSRLSDEVLRDMHEAHTQRLCRA